MSVQFGRWNFDGAIPSVRYLEEVHALLRPYGPDFYSSYINSGVVISYLAFHTTEESRHEVQPFSSSSGILITWDGRLDNREDLRSDLPHLASDCSDISIVAAAYEKWGTGSFAKLVGDWSLSVWDPNNRSLILARDPIGTRPLYFSADTKQVTWCTILDPLVLFAGHSLKLDKEYVAGWLSFFPATHLTPYEGIHSVPPSCFVKVEKGKRSTSRYWHFDSIKTIRYRSDFEYEEHFQHLFLDATGRRLRCHVPVLAELSGGMDSSSIVCTADLLIARGMARTTRLDTVSYYSHSEPNWNELPYFTAVEEQRNCVGTHINVDPSDRYSFDFDNARFTSIPQLGQLSDIHKQLLDCMATHGNRVLLSGIGGDEVLGGVPTPTAELADLLATANFYSLAHQLKLWALNKRKPWLHLLIVVLRQFLPPHLFGLSKDKQPAPWLHGSIVRRHRAALAGYEHRLTLSGPPPSFQDNIATLNMLRRQLACLGPQVPPLCEIRYPFLDRDLLEFLYAIPREQLVRPGQRRSLMRRALRGVVPEIVLERKRKASITRAPLAALAANARLLQRTNEDMICAILNLVDAPRFWQTLTTARQGLPAPMIAVTRTLALESWLGTLARRGLLADVGVRNVAEVSVKRGPMTSEGITL